jgi:cell division septum initiation protein DivIVA
MSSRPHPQRDPSVLLSLPRVDDIPRAKDGYDPDRVALAFDIFERQLGTLQARISVLEAGATGGQPGAHAMRMDALALIRTAAEYAETLEQDAVEAAARQMEAARADMRATMDSVALQLADLSQRREESERERQELLADARRMATELRAQAQRDADELRRDAELRATRLVEQARHESTDLTNATRAEIERSLDWARRHTETVLNRAREGAERLLAAAGADPVTLAELSSALVDEVQHRAPADDDEPQDR